MSGIIADRLVMCAVC